MFKMESTGKSNGKPPIECPGAYSRLLRVELRRIIKPISAGIFRPRKEDRIVRLADDVKRLQLDVASHGERLARLEGKFELLEATVPARRRKLPDLVAKGGFRT